MDHGIIGMPFKLAMSSELSRRQFYSRAQAVLVERDQLRAEVEEMRKDAERLDFMIDERAVIQELLALDGPRFTLAWNESGEFQKHVYGTPREAIDAAMAAKEVA